MGYLFLPFTILFESAAIICMKLSEGFQNRSWSVPAIAGYIISSIFLTLALKPLPSGMANAIWAGSSAVLVALLSVLIFKERIDLLQWIFLTLIISGIVGLSLYKST